MPKPIKKSAKKTDPVHAILENLVVPALRESDILHVDGTDSFEIEKEDGKWHVTGILESVHDEHCGDDEQSGHPLFVSGEAIDRERIQLSIDLAVGYSFVDFYHRAMLVGGMLEGTHFHVHGGYTAVAQGKFLVGFDLVVRADDELLIKQRIQQLANVGHQLDWYFSLRMPERLGFFNVTNLYDLWPEWDFMDREELLDKELEKPAFERHDGAAITIAFGLGRWEDVLRVLDEIADDIDAKDREGLKFIALRALGRWRPAIAAAKRAGIKDGRFDEEPWLSPEYLDCLIRADCDIEALKLLGTHQDDEPPFYDWLRGLALHRAGDTPGAEKCFERYFQAYPGDLLARSEHGELLGEDEDD